MLDLRNVRKVCGTSRVSRIRAEDELPAVPERRAHRGVDRDSLASPNSPERSLKLKTTSSAESCGATVLFVWTTSTVCAMSVMGGTRHCANHVVVVRARVITLD
jgi:hypothetical protein